LVIMAIVTSLMSGPLIKRVLRLSASEGFWKHLKPSAFHRFTAPKNPLELIGVLGAAIDFSSKNPKKIASSLAEVLRHIPLPIVGIGHGVAVPHIRIGGITRPHLAAGISDFPLDIESPDGIPVRVVFLLITPEGSNEIPLQFFAGIAKTFSREDVYARVAEAKSFTDFLAAVRPAEGE
jgi:mannitol/fructose-specific phosphotransferase system IIA component (Ntr-type)